MNLSLARAKLEQLTRSELVNRRVVGARGSLSDSFLAEVVPRAKLILPDKLLTVLLEALGLPRKLLSGTVADYKEQAPDLLEMLMREEICPVSLAWELAEIPPGKYAFVDTYVPDSFLANTSEDIDVLLAGDPLAANSEHPLEQIDRLLLGVDNRVSVPLEALILLRDMGFAPEQHIPANDVAVAHKGDIAEMPNTVIVGPSWAALNSVPMATKNDFPKDTFPVAAHTLATAKRMHLQNSTVLGRIYATSAARSCVKMPASLREAEDTPWATILDSPDVPDALRLRVFNGDVPRWLSGWQYSGKEFRVYTAYAVPRADSVLVLPALSFWSTEEKAWYLYKAATQAKKQLGFMWPK